MSDGRSHLPLYLSSILADRAPGPVLCNRRERRDLYAGRDPALEHQVPAVVRAMWDVSILSNCFLKHI